MRIITRAALSARTPRGCRSSPSSGCMAARGRSRPRPPRAERRARQPEAIRSRRPGRWPVRDRACRASRARPATYSDRLASQHRPLMAAITAWAYRTYVSCPGMCGKPRKLRCSRTARTGLGAFVAARADGECIAADDHRTERLQQGDGDQPDATSCSMISSRRPKLPPDVQVLSRV